MPRAWTKYLRKLGADADNIKVLIERSICAEVIVFVKPGRGVGFARMRVQNENLRLIRFEPYWASGAEDRIYINVIAGGVFYRHASGYGRRYDSRRCRSGALHRGFRCSSGFGRTGGFLRVIGKGDGVLYKLAAVCAQV